MLYYLNAKNKLHCVFQFQWHWLWILQASITLFSNPGSAQKPDNGSQPMTATESFYLQLISSPSLSWFLHLSFQKMSDYISIPFSFGSIKWTELLNRSCSALWIPGLNSLLNYLRDLRINSQWSHSLHFSLNFYTNVTMSYYIKLIQNVMLHRLLPFS